MLPWLKALLLAGLAFGAQRADFKEGELLVKLHRGVVLDGAASSHARLGAIVLRDFTQLGWQHVRLPPHLTAEYAMARYRTRPEVAAVARNHRRKLTSAPTDPRFKDQWALRKIGATNAWAFTTGSPELVVAVIDSGINDRHEDLRDNMWINPGEIPGNRVDDDRNGYVDDLHGIDPAGADADPNDDTGHGTAVAGIIGAVANNGKGIAGLNWQVRLMGLRHSVGDESYDAETMAAFDYVVLMKRRGVNIRVTNNSYGALARDFSPALKDAFDAADREGILNVVSVTNESLNNDIMAVLPANFNSPSILNVTASDQNDNLATFSDYGARTVDLAAPGVGILSTRLGTSSYALDDGTSFACPHVAGAAALLVAARPTLSVAELKSAILGTVDLPRGLKGKLSTEGRLNVARALQNAVDPNAPPFVTAVSPEGNHTPVNARVEITFSRAMNRATVEGAFTLGGSANGTFEWSNADRTMSFIPASPVVPGTEYVARLLGSAADTGANRLDGNFNRVSQNTPIDDYSWAFRVPPLHDDFAAAQAIEAAGLAGQVSSFNTYATKERGEPKHARNEGGASVWFRWTAPAGGQASFDTAGSTFDTVLAAYRGSELTALTPVASNDDAGGLRSSRITFEVQARVSYLIAVDSKYDPLKSLPYGRITLNWSLTPTSPELTVRALSTTELKLAWPAWATGFVLEVSPSLGGAFWASAAGAPIVSGDQVEVTLRAESRAGFYRLRKQ
jgi:subtilisin family serine protease